VAESDANFIWVRLPDAGDPAAAEAAIVAGLRQRGVLVRAGSALGEAGTLRVTVGTPAENERFVAALRAVLA
jgi:histidinol-phosphate aminotransferase